MKESAFSIDTKHRRRPGPFGPAWALLPKDQQPLVLEGSTPASDAIERLVDNGFSQIPVADKTVSVKSLSVKKRPLLALLKSPDGD